MYDVVVLLSVTLRLELFSLHKKNKIVTMLVTRLANILFYPEK